MERPQTVKISFIGDIMCEKSLLKASKRRDGQYDFSGLFSNMRHHFRESDYVVGNLETVCAGEERLYTNYIYSFNTPDAFIAAIGEAGINMVTTANNHCLDRGIVGLERTLSLLDKFNIEHTGTYASRRESEKLFVKQINRLKLAFLSYTYGTNYAINKEVLPAGEEYRVNLLKSQKGATRPGDTGRGFFRTMLTPLVRHVTTVEQRMRIKKLLRVPHNRPQVDNLKKEDLDAECLNEIRADIEKAKSEADFVIMCAHCGGQYNPEPGEFSKYMMRFLAESGVGAVVGVHPHIVQKYQILENGSLCFYSLGNFCLSPSSAYMIPDCLPEYSVMLHLYVGEGDGKARIEKANFTILKTIEDANHRLTVYPVSDLIKIIKRDRERERLIHDVTFIYNRFTGAALERANIVDEYEFSVS